MSRVKLGTRRQITLPADTIERLGIMPGEELELVEHEKVSGIDDGLLAQRLVGLAI